MLYINFLVLDAPTNVVVRDVTEESAMVSWDKVQAEVDGYILSYSSAEGSSDELRVGADSTSYQLTGLKPGVVYTICVWAIKGSRSSRKATTETETGLGNFSCSKTLRLSGKSYKKNCILFCC